MGLKKDIKKMTGTSNMNVSGFIGNGKSNIGKVTTRRVTKAKSGGKKIKKAVRKIGF